MPRFFFDVCNGHGLIRDEEGIDLETQASARQVAIDSVRSMVAEDARKGVLDLKGRIDLKDSAGNILIAIYYMEAFEVQMPGADEPR